MAHGKSWAIISFVFLACCLSFSQIPTPIRSVSSLPATCKGGSAVQMSDMVILITAGTGVQYLCTAPNVWSPVAGSGSISGSPNVNIQVAGNGSAFFAQSKPIYDTRDWMTCDGSTDVTASMQTLLSTIGASNASIRFVKSSGPCNVVSMGFPANTTLDYSGGGALQPITDATAPGGGGFDQAGSGGTAISSNTCTVAVTPSVAGESYWLSIMFGFSAGTVNRPTSTIASDFIPFLPNLISTANNSSNIAGWLIPNVVGGARTFTVTTTSSGPLVCQALAVSGLGKTPALDGAGRFSSGTATPMSSGAFTFLSGSFLIGFGGTNSNAETCTAGAGFTQPTGNAGNVSGATWTACTEFQASSSAGSATATQNLSSAPTTNAWFYGIVGLRPGSAQIYVAGGIHNPDAHKIFYNATGTAGQIYFLGNISGNFKVPPEWWGGSPTASAATNAGPVQAAISAALGTGLPVYNKTLDLSRGIYSINAETKWYGVRGNQTSRFQVDCGNAGGLSQATANLRVMDSQGMAYGSFFNCQWQSTANNTNPTVLLDIDWNGIATPNSLKPQFLDFYGNSWIGNGTTDVGLLGAKTGGGAQFSNIYLYDPAFQGFSGAGFQIGGNNTGRNAGRFYAQNALAVDIFGGDMQGCPTYGFANYGGGYITIHGVSFECGFTSQTGFDMYSEAGQGPLVGYQIRSESRRLMAGGWIECHQCATSDQSVKPTPGGTLPVFPAGSSIISGSSVAWDGHYYKVTVSGAPGFVGTGTSGAPQFASGGSPTTVANTNSSFSGSVTSGTCTLSETITQATSAATAVLLSTTAPFWVNTVTGAPDNSHVWTGGTSACTITPTTAPATAGYTVNAFASHVASILSGTNVGCFGVISSNTADTITIASWTSHYFQARCSQPDSTSRFIVEPNWGTQTTSGGMTWADLNENGIEGDIGAGLSRAVLDKVDVPGDKISIANNTAIYFRNVTTTRNDWANLPSGNVYQTGAMNGNELDVFNRTTAANSIDGGASLMTRYQAWSLPRSTGSRTYYSGPFQHILGTKALVWECGDTTGVQGACSDVWIGGRSDSTAGGTASRNVLEFGGMLGRASAFGTDIAGTDTDITGGPSTGTGAGGAINFWTSNPGASSATVNSGLKRWLVSAAGHWITGLDNTYDIGATGATRPRNIYVAGQLIPQVATGTPPIAATSTTPVAHLTTVPTTYNHSGTQQTEVHLVQDSCTLGTDCGVTLTGSAVYTNATSYTCVCEDDTAIAACRVNQTAGNGFTITGTGTDVIRYHCTGN